MSYGRPQSTIEDALVAAKAADAHDFIMRQSLGYETLLDEHGAGLSGGERQRLSIARTLLYDPKILILDEATNNIDAESERSIQEAVEVLVRGRTTIAIAHRLSTLRNADRILVIDRGRSGLIIRQGFLEFDVITELGHEAFSMRWTQSHAIDFGERGKLLMDTEENRYWVPDIEALPPQDRERFLQYVYW